VLGSNSRISSDSKRQLLSSRQPGNLFAKPNTLVDIVRPILPSSQTAVARQLPVAGAYLGTASNTCAESSMTIRFRAAEADELVDDERTAQRIYIASAMTMEPGEFYCFLEQAPIPNPMQFPAACLPLLPVNASRSPLNPSGLQSPSFSLPFPGLLCRFALRSGRFLLPLQSAPLRCLKRAFSFLLSLASYDSIDRTPAPGCGVTLGIRLSFHVHDRPRTRASCAPPTHAASFSLCIE
jgi:hypothetical protein